MQEAFGAGAMFGAGNFMLWPQVIASSPNFLVILIGFLLALAGMVTYSDSLFTESRRASR